MASEIVDNSPDMAVGVYIKQEIDLPEHREYEEHTATLPGPIKVEANLIQDVVIKEEIDVNDGIFIEEKTDEENSDDRTINFHSVYIKEEIDLPEMENEEDFNDMFEMEDEEWNDCTASEFATFAEKSQSCVIPSKSRERYVQIYDWFLKWKNQSKTDEEHFSENVLLAYFGELSATKKPSTLWTVYSMLRCMLKLKHDVDISKYSLLLSFIKGKSQSYHPEEIKIFNEEQIVKFLEEAPDNKYLLEKVAIVLGLLGACRPNELKSLTMSQFEKIDDIYLVHLHKGTIENKRNRTFTISDKCFLNIINKYIQLRPKKSTTDCFFLKIVKGKCINLPIGINTMYKFPKVIAEYLKLPQPEQYRGHSFIRKPSMANAVAEMITKKNRGNYTSTAVAKECAGNSVEHKKRIEWLIGYKYETAQPTSSAITRSLLKPTVTLPTSSLDFSPESDSSSSPSDSSSTRDHPPSSPTTDDMTQKNQQKPDTRRYKDYSDETLWQCISDVESGRMSQRKAAKFYKIPRRTINYKLKGQSSNLPGRPTIFCEKEEKMFVSCVIKFCDYGFPIDSFDLRMIIKEYLTSCRRTVTCFKDNFPGVDWLKSFLNRHPELSQRFASNLEKRRAAISEKVIRSYIQNLGNVVSGIPPENIWSYDESNLSDDPSCEKIIWKRKTKYPDRMTNSSKSCTTVMFSANAAGELHSPYVVYRSTFLRGSWTEGGPAKTRYSSSLSGWFDSSTFTDWFKNVMLPRLKKLTGRKVIIGDNLSSHINIEVLTLCETYNVSFVCLPMNSTHLTQPLDVGFFRPLESAWTQVLTDWKMHTKASIIPKNEFPSLLNKLVSKLLPNAKSNIILGFKKCGISPINVNEILSMPKSKKNDAHETCAIQNAFSISLKEMRERLLRKNAPGNVILAENYVPEEPLTKKFKKSILMSSDDNGNGNNHDDKKFKVDNDSGISISDDASDNDLNEEGDQYEKEIDEVKEMTAVTAKRRIKLLKLRKIRKEKGEYVVFAKGGTLLPGKTLKFNEKEVTLSAMEKSMTSYKWPKTISEQSYLWKDILGGIEQPKLLSKRGFYSVPELSTVWWL